ncbi:hypothetical protein ABZV81_35750, partial [Streptomyces parvus]|uniref:hypothetical protein n=1 Tax=Streptomyces parvus TaxID=66428 RepID=UPI0033A3CF7A
TRQSGHQRAHHRPEQPKRPAEETDGPSRKIEADITEACQQENSSGDIGIASCLQIHIWHFMRIPVREDSPEPCPNFLDIDGWIDSQCYYIGRKLELLRSIILKSQNQPVRKYGDLVETSILNSSRIVHDAVTI